MTTHYQNLLSRWELACTPKYPTSLKKENFSPVTSKTLIDKKPKNDANSNWHPSVRDYYAKAIMACLVVVSLIGPVLSQ